MFIPLCRRGVNTEFPKNVELWANNFQQQVGRSAPKIAFFDSRTPITDMFWPMHGLPKCKAGNVTPYVLTAAALALRPCSVLISKSSQPVRPMGMTFGPGAIRVEASVPFQLPQCPKRYLAGGTIQKYGVYPPAVAVNAE